MRSVSPSAWPGLTIVPFIVQNLFVESFPEETVSQKTFSDSGSYYLSDPVPWCFLSRRCRSCDVDVSTGTGFPWSLNLCNMSCDFLWCSPLAVRETSLVRGGSYIYLVSVVAQCCILASEDFELGLTGKQLQFPLFSCVYVCIKLTKPSKYRAGLSFMQWWITITSFLLVG